MFLTHVIEAVIACHRALQNERLVRNENETKRLLKIKSKNFSPQNVLSKYAYIDRLVLLCYSFTIGKNYVKILLYLTFFIPLIFVDTFHFAKLTFTFSLPFLASLYLSLSLPFTHSYSLTLLFFLPQKEIT